MLDRMKIGDILDRVVFWNLGRTKRRGIIKKKRNWEKEEKGFFFCFMRAVNTCFPKTFFHVCFSCSFQVLLPDADLRRSA